MVPTVSMGVPLTLGMQRGMASPISGSRRAPHPPQGYPTNEGFPQLPPQSLGSSVHPTQRLDKGEPPMIYCEGLGVCWGAGGVTPSPPHPLVLPHFAVGQKIGVLMQRPERM